MGKQVDLSHLLDLVYSKIGILYSKNGLYRRPFIRQS